MGCKFKKGEFKWCVFMGCKFKLCQILLANSI
ncbi:MAG: hypothetical protein EBV32_05965 [Proteobacteria bacterium]|uniref:Uncharacterized protein n=1 Tax=Candidatus Fonsibacter lacus TaxID=2576439 RepID=A0A964V5Q9_9PROT|nr:hypothetical protein [Candidatus Fonsibacter lacus]